MFFARSMRMHTCCSVGFSAYQSFPVFERSKCSDIRGEKMNVHGFFYTYIRYCINQVLPSQLRTLLKRIVENRT